jgi:hypothetical protein
MGYCSKFKYFNKTILNDSFKVGGTMECSDEGAYFSSGGFSEYK